MVAAAVVRVVAVDTEVGESPRFGFAWTAQREREENVRRWAR